MVGKILPQMIEIRQGDSFTIRLQFRNDKGFIDITGSLLKMQVRNRNDNKVVMTKIGSLDDAVNGKACLEITSADTKNLQVAGDYIADIQITFANGEVHTIYPQDVNKVAAFVVSQNVTE